MKICAYTIALNESQFVERWAETTKNCDYRVVMDTGSTDDTVSKCQAHGITTHSIRIKPWRFDDARNTALALLPEDVDICISLDMDELLTDGWRSKIESAWTDGTNRLKYGYAWSDQVTFLSDKIHGRFSHRWRHPCHEIVSPTVDEKINTITDLIIDHQPDSSKSRGQYLPLLELAKKEDPSDDRTAHYLGREYFFWGRYYEAILELTRHLSLPKATWKSERASSMRYMAKCYEAIQQPDFARHWYDQAVLEEPSRESLVEAAKFALKEQRYNKTIDLCELALRTDQTQSYMADRYCNHEGPYDLLSIAYYHAGQPYKAGEATMVLAAYRQVSAAA